MVVSVHDFTFGFTLTFVDMCSRYPFQLHGRYKHAGQDFTPHFTGFTGSHFTVPPPS